MGHAVSRGFPTVDKILLNVEEGQTRVAVLLTKGAQTRQPRHPCLLALALLTEALSPNTRSMCAAGARALLPGPTWYSLTAGAAS